MAIFKSEIKVRGESVTLSVEAHKAAMLDLGDGFHNLDAKSVEDLAEDLKAAALKMRAIMVAVK